MEETFLPDVEEAGPENVVLSKSFAFGVRIIRLYRHLMNRGCEAPLANQLLRSGTSIGANVEEGIGAISRAEFATKLSISYKEARETSYWLRLLHAADSLTEAEYTSIYQDSEELCRLLRSILNKLRNPPTPPPRQ